MLRIVRTETRSIQVTDAMQRAVFDLLADEAKRATDTSAGKLGVALVELEWLSRTKPELVGVLDRTLERHGSWDYERLTFDLYD